MSHVDDDRFWSKVFNKLSDVQQKNIVMIIDEVYDNPITNALSRVGGFIYSKAINKPDQLDNTLLCFMIVCLFGRPKFIMKILAVKELDSMFQYNETT